MTCALLQSAQPSRVSLEIRITGFVWMEWKRYLFTNVNVFVWTGPKNTAWNAHGRTSIPLPPTTTREMRRWCRNSPVTKWIHGSTMPCEPLYDSFNSYDSYGWTSELYESIQVDSIGQPSSPLFTIPIHLNQAGVTWHAFGSGLLEHCQILSIMV